MQSSYIYCLGIKQLKSVSLPGKTKGNIDHQLHVGYPGNGWVVYGPVANVHDGIFITQILRTST